jgi:hypothetical protein
MPNYDQKMYHALEARAMKDNQEILCWDRHEHIEENDACVDFVERFARRFREFYESHFDDIVVMCREHCNNGCKGVGMCDLDKDTLHEKIILIDKSGL